MLNSFQGSFLKLTCKSFIKFVKKILLKNFFQLKKKKKCKFIVCIPITCSISPAKDKIRNDIVTLANDKEVKIIFF